MMAKYIYVHILNRSAYILLTLYIEIEWNEREVQYILSTYRDGGDGGMQLTIGDALPAAV